LPLGRAAAVFWYLNGEKFGPTCVSEALFYTHTLECNLFYTHTLECNKDIAGITHRLTDLWNSPASLSLAAVSYCPHRIQPEPYGFAPKSFTIFQPESERKVSFFFTHPGSGSNFQKMEKNKGKQGSGHTSGHTARTSPHSKIGLESMSHLKRRRRPISQKCAKRAET